MRQKFLSLLCRDVLWNQVTHEGLTGLPKGIFIDSGLLPNTHSLYTKREEDVGFPVRYLMYRTNSLHASVELV